MWKGRSVDALDPINRSILGWGEWGRVKQRRSKLGLGVYTAFYT